MQSFVRSSTSARSSTSTREIIVSTFSGTVLTKVMLLTTGKDCCGHRSARSQRPDVRMLRPPLDRSIRTPGCDDNTNMTRLSSKGNGLNELRVK
jgi:hypothetical protein